MRGRRGGSGPGRCRLGIRCGVGWERRGWLVEGVEDRGEKVDVFNFRVADFHTYFVGACGVGLQRFGA